jgi:DNA-binding transcriptional MerR regulator
MDTPKYITRNAVARRYSVSARTVSRWEAAGTLPPARIINRKRYYAVAELDRLDREALSARAAS